MQSKVKVNFLKRNCFSSLYFVLSTGFFCQQYRSISYDLYKLLCVFLLYLYFFFCTKCQIEHLIWIIKFEFQY